MNQTLIFDLESTGLLRRGSKIHCIVANEPSCKEDPLIFDNKPDQSIEMGIAQLQRAEAIVGHNLIGYDIPLIRETYEFEPEGEVIDTLVLSRLFWPHLEELDFKVKPKGMPQRIWGSHSLKAWGYRLQCFKGDYAEHEGAWDIYSPEMLDYCIQDTKVTGKLYEKIMVRMESYAA